MLSLLRQISQDAHVLVLPAFVRAVLAGHSDCMEGFVVVGGVVVGAHQNVVTHQVLQGLVLLEDVFEVG